MKDDHQAVAHLKQGDLGSLDVLVSRYYIPAVRAAYLVVQDRGMAEDVVQNSFLNLSVTIKQFDSKRSFEPWFLRCVINAAINTNHRESRLVSLDQVEEDSASFSVENWLQEQTDGPAEQVEAGEKRQAIWQALGKLTRQQRAAVVMRYYLELSESEMASDLDCPKSSIKWWLHSARVRLRGLLQAFEPVSRPSNKSKEERQ
jgi:RNA polymerase sigma-70 factor, ECF subfamily